MKLSFKDLGQFNQLTAILKDKLSKECISYGVDIGTAFTKLVKLRFFKESYELLDIKVEPTSVDQVSSLKKCLAGQNIKKANISLSGPSTIVRYTPFPKMKDAELRTAMKFEAEKLIPFSINEVGIDAVILKNDLPENKMLVLLAAAKKDAINQRIKLLDGAGLRPGFLDLDSLAVVNAFNHSFGQESGKGKSAALLNIGAAFSNLSIIEEGVPRFSRDFQIAGNSFTQKISESLGVDAKTAEALKANPDEANREKVRIAVDAVLSNLASEARLSFDYYESQCACTVSKIFLSGAGSLSPGLREALSELIGLDVDYWDPLKNITGSDTLKNGTQVPLNSHLAVATGLALRV